MIEDDAMRFDQAAYAIACARMKSAPLELNEHDFSTLAIVSPRLEDDARFAQKSAQLAVVRARTDPAAVQTKAVEPAARVPTMCKVPQDVAADEIIKTIKAALQQNNETWETKYRALETRLLELEAREAAHAER